MTNRVFYIHAVLYFVLTFCHSQMINYQCNFDNDVQTGDCQFKVTSGAFGMTFSTGVLASATSNQPLSDVTSIQSLTTPNGESCLLPYSYPSGNWQMHFCNRTSTTSYTCPTASGPGQCVIGKYASKVASGSGRFDQTYVADVQQSLNTVQCLDFYYYMTDTSSNAKMEVGWIKDVNTEPIVEVRAMPEKKWQHSQTNFTAPSASPYQLAFRMTRDTTGFSFYFALDEIKIYDQPCGSPPLTTTIPTSTDLPAALPDTSAQTSKPDEETSTTIIPIVQTTDVETTVIASAIPLTTTTAAAMIITTVDNSQPPMSTQGIEETSNPKIPTETTTISTSTVMTTISTTIEPLIPIFTCDFSVTFCFQDSELVITNGTEFISDDINESPRAPLSDVTSINEPTNNNETCQLPYQLSMHNSTNTTSLDMWFCYKNECPTKSEELSTCTSGNYGLISLDSWETNKTIMHSISRDGDILRDLVGEQCLRYYYYLTVYDQLDWDQQLSISIKSDNEIEIDRVSVAEMIENRWYQRNITFNSTTTNYTLIFHFDVINANRSEDPLLNKTIYFALDNIDLYDRHCDDVLVPPTTSIITQSPITTTTNKNDEGTPNPEKQSSNLPFILGLSLGLGIPAMAIVIGVLFFSWRKRKTSYFNLHNDTEDGIPMKRSDGRFDSDSSIFLN